MLRFRFGHLLAGWFILVLSLSGCDDQQTANDPSLAPRLRDIQQAGTLMIGTALTSPFEYHDPNINNLVGFDVDLATLIADRLGVALEWKEMAFADLLSELNAGKVDMVIAAMYITPERETLVDFTQPYLATGLVMVIQTGDTRISDFESLEGKTLGVKEGATGERWADALRDAQGIEMTILRYENTLDSLDDLAAGLLDVVINDKLNTLEYIKTHPQVQITGDVFDPAGLGIAVQTGDDDLRAFLNETLADLQQSGDIDRLFDKWINPETTP